MGSHGYRENQEHETKHLSGVTGLKSSVLREYAY